ncbi:hypothetical protein LA080_010199 [Diaporthe eres]|nr:hypothetical protein LA080_010199 [Diaporthe eres]
MGIVAESSCAVPTTFKHPPSRKTLWCDGNRAGSQRPEPVFYCAISGAIGRIHNKADWNSSSRQQDHWHRLWAAVPFVLMSCQAQPPQPVAVCSSLSSIRVQSTMWSVTLFRAFPWPPRQMFSPSVVLAKLFAPSFAGGDLPRVHLNMPHDPYAGLRPQEAKELGPALSITSRGPIPEPSEVESGAPRAMQLDRGLALSLCALSASRAPLETFHQCTLPQHRDFENHSMVLLTRATLLYMRIMRGSVLTTGSTSIHWGSAIFSSASQDSSLCHGPCPLVTVASHAGQIDYLRRYVCLCHDHGDRRVLVFA